MLYKFLLLYRQDSMIVEFQADIPTDILNAFIKTLIDCNLANVFVQVNYQAVSLLGGKLPNSYILESGIVSIAINYDNQIYKDHVVDNFTILKYINNVTFNYRDCRRDEWWEEICLDWLNIYTNIKRVTLSYLVSGFVLHEFLKQNHTVEELHLLEINTNYAGMDKTSQFQMINYGLAANFGLLKFTYQGQAKFYRYLRRNRLIRAKAALALIACHQYGDNPYLSSMDPHVILNIAKMVTFSPMDLGSLLVTAHSMPITSKEYKYQGIIGDLEIKYLHQYFKSKESQAEKHYDEDYDKIMVSPAADDWLFQKIISKNGHLKLTWCS